MPALAKQVEAPVTPEAPYGLLKTFPAKAMPDHGGLAGLTYDTDFCGTARPWVAPCITPETVEASVSVDAAGLATVTAPGAPAGDYAVNWGDGTVEVVNPVNGATHQYDLPGDYPLSVTASGLSGSVVVTVETGVASGPFAVNLDAVKVADDGIDQTEGGPIPLYHLFSCRLVGSGTDQDRRDRARRSLDLGASRALEEGFGDTIGASAVDVTPGGTAVGVTQALAILEQYGGANYGGRRVIHASLDVVTYLIAQDLVTQVGDHLETILGSIVVAGPGYAGRQVPSAPAEGAQWMYATGAVNVWQEDVANVTVLASPYDNEFNALAERIYVPTYECFAAAVETTLEA